VHLSQFVPLLATDDFVEWEEADQRQMRAWYFICRDSGWIAGENFEQCIERLEQASMQLFSHPANRVRALLNLYMLTWPANEVLGQSFQIKLGAYIADVGSSALDVWHSSAPEEANQMVVDLAAMAIEVPK
jgi:hypothetical protein